MRIVRRMAETGINTPLTSSAGRLFDAAAALLGVRDEITYEGQAAIELEQLARGGDLSRAPGLVLDIAERDGELVVDPASALEGLVRAELEGVSRADLALAFHAALARALADCCGRVRDGGAPQTVALCGGVFQNRILTRTVAHELRLRGLEPILPGEIPVSDAGLALGQVLAANAALGAHPADASEG
jgi:hydrogenase maturation protein HypF